MNKLVPALAYGWLTPAYDLVMRLTMREQTFRSMLLAQCEFPRNARVLDVGCGTGTLAIQLSQMRPDLNIVGIDGDSTVLEIARGKARNSPSTIQFDLANASALPYHGESFDRVLSSLMFHHLDSEQKLNCLREIRRVLKSDGEFHLVDWGKPANVLASLGFLPVRLLDGLEVTAANFHGELPRYIGEAGFADVVETSYLNTVFGTLRFIRGRAFPALMFDSRRVPHPRPPLFL